ncbi:DUF2795 domain-containing protein [Sinomonas gamaensis]|uniref:DUF2795 domain-containing protein n=1 Tax=Sinomonas gamaensis TaxID=2565624 RepID=UPI001108FE20|nr:DUF2795 domain-containing protein [Sinomonas gamaensis]
MTDTVNPIQIQKFLQGVDYPADKAALVSAAKDNGADSNVVRAVEGIPERTYEKPTEVSEAIVEAGRHPESHGKIQNNHGNNVEPDGVPGGDTDDEGDGERFDAG